MITHKIISKHQKDCDAFKQNWKTVWGVYQRTVFGRKKSPLSSGNNQWLIFGCNVPGCPAELAVSLEEIYLECKNK